MPVDIPLSTSGAEATTIVPNKGSMIVAVVAFNNKSQLAGMFHHH
jgi:hypothetical protein